MNDNITEINKDTFWALIQEAKDTCGQDTDAWAKYMIDRLAGLGPDQSLMFLNYMDAYKDLSFRYGLWDAAKIFRVDGCSDDSFSYFRSWLIVQGKDVYMAALADPDSLADVEPYADCFFETAGYWGSCRSFARTANPRCQWNTSTDSPSTSSQSCCPASTKRTPISTPCAAT